MSKTFRTLTLTGMLAPLAWVGLMLFWAALYTLADKVMGEDSYLTIAIILVVAYWTFVATWLGAVIACLLVRLASRVRWALLGAGGGVLFTSFIGVAGWMGMPSGGPFIRTVNEAGLALLFLGWALVPLGLGCGLAVGSLPPFVRSTGAKRAESEPVYDRPSASSQPKLGDAPGQSRTAGQTAMSWVSSLLGVPHLVVSVPGVVYCLLFLTVRFDLGGLSGHPARRTWAERVPEQIIVLCIAIPVMLLGLLLILAGYSLASVLERGRRLIAWAAAACGVLAVGCLVAVLGCLVIPPRVLDPIVGGIYPRWLLCLAPSVGLWVYGSYAVLVYALLHQKRFGVWFRRILIALGAHAVLLLILAIAETWLDSPPEPQRGVIPLETPRKGMDEPKK